MADLGQIDGGTVPADSEQTRPGLRHQRTTIATSTTTQTTSTSSLPIDPDPTLAPAPAPVHFATLPRLSDSPWLFSPYSGALDFTDLDLASPPATTTPSAAALAPQHRQPQARHPLLHVPAFPLPLPQPSLGPSPVTSHLFLHAAGPIFSSPPPPTGFAGLLAARPSPQLHSPPSFSFADPSFPSRLPPLPAAPPLMPPRQGLEQQTRLERLLSSLADTSPSPRPRSSRRPRNSSPSSPSDRSGSRLDVKRERAGSQTPTPVDPSTAAMPVVTRKRAAAAAAASSLAGASSSSSRPAAAAAQPAARALKRQRTTTTQQQPANRQRPNPIPIDSDAFSDPFEEGAADLDDIERQAKAGSQKGPRLKEEDELADIIDLVDDDVPPPPPKPKSANQVKLSNMQCSICMDDMTNLTVTHCGHLFCGECLHGALHANLNKSVCPICRQKIDPRANGAQNPKTPKGFFQLQLKLMTSNRKGKMKEGGASR
ncbi:hypothetical protein RB601_007185 [Gaeumannomyces tritici]